MCLALGGRVLNRYVLIKGGSAALYIKGLM